MPASIWLMVVRVIAEKLTLRHEKSHGGQCYSSNVGSMGPRAESNHCALWSYDDKKQRKTKFHLFL